MDKFKFISRKDSIKICELIVKEMINEFGISEEEAVGRMNELWQNTERGPIDKDEDFLNYESSNSWAFIVYYGNNDQWWNKSKSQMKPRPYPEE
ncbi:hypothetical protein NQ117_08660 [Paenibacillus sp. SC116]|uniref:hypothetical protein n=1 Tax=Paenibacillus sp. SC116 TaxID=2968986 RepID=UPI00215AB72A|nr:hypothetical protein [Paenibacillus sp. SC116]MCR8843757.1 hypothetical protein [Paenibacillus sp. SC116]